MSIQNRDRIKTSLFSLSWVLAFLPFFIIFGAAIYCNVLLEPQLFNAQYVFYLIPIGFFLAILTGIASCQFSKMHGPWRWEKQIYFHDKYGSTKGILGFHCFQDSPDAKILYGDIHTWSGKQVESMYLDEAYRHNNDFKTIKGAESWIKSKGWILDKYKLSHP